MTAEPSTAGIGVPLSILDLAQVGRGETVGESLAHSTRLAQYADTTGYHRIWYAEHHNMSAIASAAPAVLVAHMAAHTERIRLGAGGVMLPNHSPLTIAEQYGTLAELHPGRIDLGLGRAPGGDQATFAALRRTHQAADEFPRDVVELQAYLRDSAKDVERMIALARQRGPGAGGRRAGGGEPVSAPVRQRHADRAQPVVRDRGAARDGQRRPRAHRGDRPHQLGRSIAPG